MARDLAGIILAAGLGTRLRPISGGVPKPLVPFFSLPLIEFVFKKFALAGISDVGLNTHFLPEKIEEYLKAFHHSDVFLSKETPDILGTGGAYYGFKPWVKNRTTVVCNGDVLTSADLGAIVDHHFDTDAFVTMGVRSQPHDSGSQIWVDKGLVVHIGPNNGGFTHASPHGFNCIRVLNGDFFDQFPKPEYSEFVPIILRLIKQGKKVVAFEQPGDWFDLGTPEDYFKAHQHVLREWSAGKDPFLVMKTLQDLGRPFTFVPAEETAVFSNSKIVGPSFMALDVEGLKSNSIGPNVVISGGISLGEGCRIQSSVVNEGCNIKDHLTLRIIGQNYSISALTL